MQVSKVTFVKLIKLSSFLSLILIPILAFGDTGSYSIYDALTSALNHPKIQARKMESNAATQKLQFSEWQRFPGVSVQSSTAQSSFSQNGATVVTTLRVEQPLWTGGRISGNIDSNKAKVAASEQAISEAEQELLLKTTNSFFNVIKFQKKIEISNQNILEHQRLLELIERRARGEVSSMSELIFAKARLDLAKSENTQFKNQLKNNIADLENYIGKPVDQLSLFRSGFNLPKTEEELISKTLEASPTLKRVEYEIEAAESDISVAKSSLWPQLSARSDQNYGGLMEGNVSYIAFTFAPGNGLSALSAKNEAIAKKEVSESLKKNAQLEITNKVRSDWNQFLSEINQIETFSNLTQTTQGVYQSNVRQFEIGKKTWIEVLNSKRENTQANYALADSEANYFSSGIRLQILTGDTMLRSLSTP
jgi:outer membrane protein, adhesin transport system